MSFFNNRFPLIPLTFFFAATLLPCLAAGQSTIVQVGVPDASMAVEVPASDYSVPNSMTSQQLLWEQILSSDATGKLKGVRTCRDLIARLRELGLPVFLDISARDDALDFRSRMEIEFDSMRLRDVLYQVLREYNASICLRDNRILIVSADVTADPYFFHTLVYDVSSLVNDSFDAYDLMDELKASIAPDDWDDTNGDGTLVMRSMGNKTFLTMSQSYNIYRQTQLYLKDLNRMKGVVAVNRSVNSMKFSGSRVISMSNPYDTDPRFGRGFGGGGGGFGGGGIGGYGLGGGVF